MTWEELERACRACRRCRLAEGRTNVVIGRGSKNAEVLLVGEGPGRQEDEQGIPFVGAAGQLLNLALLSCGFQESDYYIGNVVKCRPPQNRNPEEDECEACIGFLRAQFALLRPKIVVCMGNVAANHLIEKNTRISAIRGRWIEKKGVWFLGTYHPAALLRDESKKLAMWNDLKMACDKMLAFRRAEE